VVAIAAPRHQRLSRLLLALGERWPAVLSCFSCVSWLSGLQVTDVSIALEWTACWESRARREDQFKALRSVPDAPLVKHLLRDVEEVIHHRGAPSFDAEDRGRTPSGPLASPVNANSSN
jgi:hypothetical protein